MTLKFGMGLKLSPSYSAPPAWTPSLTSLALWLDAADSDTVTTVSGAVSQWNDKSGNSRNATQSTAAQRPNYTVSGLNSRNVLSFTGASSHFLTFPDVTLQDDNTYVVSVMQRPSSGGQTIDVSNTFSDARFVYGNWWFSNNILYARLRSFETSHGAASNSTGFFIQIVERNSSGTQAWRNGSALGTRSLNAGNQVDAPFNMLGRVQSTYTTGIIAEVMIGRVALTDANRQRIEGYLAHKWGLTAGLPADHPYKSTPPTA